MKIENLDLLSQEPDISSYFNSAGNILYYPADELIEFSAETLTGTIRHKRLERKARGGFNAYSAPFEETQSWTFPPVYADYPEYPIKISFPTENAVRIQMECQPVPSKVKAPTPILTREPDCLTPEIIREEEKLVLRMSGICVEITEKPFSIAVKRPDGKLLTQTLPLGSGKCLQNCNPLPMGNVQRLDTLERYSAVSMKVFPDEHFYGGGESFTPFDKKGQKLILWTKDAHGAETKDMYKPVPFYMSSRGYGVFAHTSAPVTMDFGHRYQEAQTVFVGEGSIDLFLIAGTPKEILGSYTELTGKSPMPPEWTFGLWMSRITYKSEEEVREVAKKLRDYEIPCDVIHLDTGWFEEDWCCDYEFSRTRFDDPEKMIADLKEEGFRICLWQLPYFTPKNKYYHELIEKGYAVMSVDGNLPTDDAVLDYSNPDAVKWYQEKIEGLLNMGVAAIKADFGEAAPPNGQYASGKSGWLEHNLYPLRYNKAVSDITAKVTGSPLIWGRSAWAGSQRYPVHWGGDAENTDMGMLSSLRAGLSLGMCGFSFWSHDIGGFVRVSPEDLYRRWSFMGIFTSHMRCHGAPPKEPWEYSEKFLETFRKQMQLRYRLMPYVFAQATRCSQLGIPMLRAMFMEFPDDPGCLTLEDQYMFGDDILVAPMFEEGTEERNVWLPAGIWKDLLTGERYEGGRWHRIHENELGGIALIRGGAVVPVVDSALCTDMIDWSTKGYLYCQDDSCVPHGWDYNPVDKTIVPVTEEMLKKAVCVGK